MKKKLLLPIDGSDRDLISVNYVKNNFDTKDTEVILLNVIEIMYSYGLTFSKVIETTQAGANNILDKAKAELEEFNCETKIRFGYAASEILQCSNKNKVDKIIMSKHNKKKFAALVGSVTAEVLKKSRCVVTVLPQEKPE